MSFFTKPNLITDQEERQSVKFIMYMYREMTEREYIIPLTSQMQTLSLYRQLSPNSEDYTIKHTIPNMDASVSIRPKLTLTKKDIETRYIVHTTKNK